MIRPGIEPLSPRPLVNTVLIRPIYIYIYIYIKSEENSLRFKQLSNNSKGVGIYSCAHCQRLSNV